MNTPEFEILDNADLTIKDKWIRDREVKKANMRTWLYNTLK